MFPRETVTPLTPRDVVRPDTDAVVFSGLYSNMVSLALKDATLPLGLSKNMITVVF